MSAGIKWKVTEKSHLPEYCRVETIFRLSGGFNLVTTNLVAGTRIPVLAPFYVDKAARTATVIRNVRVVNPVAAGDTSARISKDSLAVVGLILGTGTAGTAVSEIDTTSAAYDVLTFETALGEALEKGTVLFEASAINGTEPIVKANFLNYAETLVEPGATVDAVGQVYEIQMEKLKSPISEKDKETFEGIYIYW